MNIPNPSDSALDAAFRRQSSWLMSDAVAGWARIVEHSMASLLALWKIPLDMVYPEDTSLGICNTSIIVPAASAGSVRCVGARLVHRGRLGAPASPDIGAQVRVTPVPASAKATVCEVEINLPPSARPGLYELTMTDDTGTIWTELHPFGVPRGDH